MRRPARDASQLAWLEYVIETAIEMLDALDAGAEDREDDEREFYCDDEIAA